MRMIDLNLNIIKKAHADDIQAYKHTKASPQHLHRRARRRHRRLDCRGPSPRPSRRHPRRPIRHTQIGQ